MNFSNKLGFIFIIFIFSFVFNKSFASDNSFLKFHKLNLKTYTFAETNPLRIGKKRGNVEEYPFGFDYYGSFKNGKISEIIETFYFDNNGDFMSRFNDWARDIVFKSNPNNGCNNSEQKSYHATVDNGAVHFSCFSVKIISSMEELYGPNFNKANHIPMVQRKKILQKALKQKYKMPNKMFRIEHFFYRSGKLIWVFYSIDVNLFFDEITQKNIETFINVAIQRHKDFEKDLRYKDHLLINFD